MIIPYVIDNRNHKLADILNSILANHGGQSMDVVTAYFNIQGYNLLKDGLSGLGSFRCSSHARSAFPSASKARLLSFPFFSITLFRHQENL